MTKSFSYIICFIFICQNAGMGQNLVRNGGFEDFSTCPTRENQLGLATDWISPTDASPDFFHRCAGRGPCQTCVPENTLGFQNAFSGDGYAGIFVVWPTFPNYQEYLQSELSSPLVPGDEYLFSIAVSFAEYSQNAADGIEIFLSDTRPLDLSTIDGFFNLDPTFSYDTIITDRENWVILETCFVAEGNERFITIGNFKTHAETTIIPVSGGRRENVYYFIDEVVIRPAVEEQLQILPNDTTICQGDTINVSLPSGRSYLWNDGSSRQNHILTEPGLYWVEVIEECYRGIDSIIIAFGAQVAAQLPDSVIICEGEEMYLVIPQLDGTWIWSDQTMNDSFLIKNSGWVWVEVTNECGSDRDSTYILLINSPKFTLPADTILCEGEELIIDLSKNQGIQWTWNDGSQETSYIIDSSGTYTVTAENRCGLAIDSVVVSYMELPSLFLSIQDTAICEGEIIVVTAGTEIGNKTTWGNGSHMETQEIREAGIYRVEAYNECGTIEAAVEVQEKICDCSVYFPNSFTPNGDQLNDVFMPFSNCSLDQFQMTIFSRWGELIFHSDDEENGWDGTFNSQAVEAGVYSYFSQYHTGPESNVRSGTITIIR